MRIANYIILLCLISTIMSCTSYESFLNYNESPRIPLEPQTITNFKPITIQANDILQIAVSSTDALAAKPFNLSGEEGGASGQYLVDPDGTIDFPTIGEIQLKGLEIAEAKDKIAETVAPYFNESPIIQLRLINFKVNVNGEVRNPGSVSVQNNRLTLIDAVTLAGDFTSYASRDSILIIREQDNVRTFGYINFNSPDVFNSPYFYLQQNDVLYIKPNKGIVNSVRDPASRFLPWISAAVSLVALLISLNRL